MLLSLLFLLFSQIILLSVRNGMNEIIIGNIIFTPLKRTLSKGDGIVKIRNKESEVLSLLCSHYPVALSREDIEEKVWEGSYVTDNTLTQTISNLRNALDDKDHELVITIPKKGYCIGIKPEFIAKGSSTSPLLPNINLPGDFEDNLIKLPSVPIPVLGRISIFIISCLFLLVSFYITSYSYQVNIISVKKLPILVGLNEASDKGFLNVYNKDPYVFLKKQKNGEYIACKYQYGVLACEKK